MFENVPVPGQEKKEVVDIFAGVNTGGAADHPIAPVPPASPAAVPAARRGRLWIILIIAILALLLIAGGLYAYAVFFRSTAQPAAQEQAQQQVPVQPAPVVEEPVTIPEVPQIPVEPTVEEPAVIPAAPIDSDGDGLSDDQERGLGTNPFAADTDGDGLFDAEEVNKYFTNPNLADTDGDGFSDKVEIDNGYNPNGDGRLPSAQ